MPAPRRGFSIDPAQGIAPADDLRLVRLGAELGYESAWTPSGGNAQSFDRCIAWYKASKLATGISVVPAPDQPPAFYAEHARRAWEETNGTFVLGVGSGLWPHAAVAMRKYVEELRPLLPTGLPLYLAALGPAMLRLAGEIADGVALNWCTPELVKWSREHVVQAAHRVGRPVPRIIEYIRTSVDLDGDLARRTLAKAALGYALGPPAYRNHFERMGFRDLLSQLERDSRVDPGPEFIAAAGASGRPGEVRPQFERLAQGLDLAIVRVLVTRPGDAESVERVLRESAVNPVVSQ